jgi:hypothetical protein
LLGLVVEGGQGLATADDRRFIAAIDGTREADEARSRQLRLEELTLSHPEAAGVYRAARANGDSIESALLVVADRFHPQKELEWPRGGEIRVVNPNVVRRKRLTPEEVKSGITVGPTWVPFEKPDDSGPVGAAAWRRDNPLVIDWSLSAVALLRERYEGRDSYRKPYFRNEHLWGKAGITFNRTASYLRARLTPEGGIFGEKTPIIRPDVPWLTTRALLALLNAPVLDFMVRSFLGSRLQIDVGHLRRLPVPVLASNQSSTLDDLGRRALVAKEALDAGRPGEALSDIEGELDRYVRRLYGFPADADLWVVR